MQSVRYGGGVWAQQEAARAALEVQLGRTQQQLHRSSTALAVASAEGEALRREVAVLQTEAAARGKELENRDAALLASAHERRQQEERVTRLQSELVLAREHGAALAADLEQRQTQCLVHKQTLLLHDARAQEAALECERLRDLLYEVQEQHGEATLALQRRHRELHVLTRSLASKDTRLAAVTKERQALAQRLAASNVHVHSATVMAPAAAARLASDRPSVVSEMAAEVESTVEVPMERRRQERSRPAPTARATVQARVAVESQVAALRTAVTHAQTRFMREQETSRALRERVHALEHAQQELLVRFREARKQQSHRGRVGLMGVAASSANAHSRPAA